MSLTFSTNVPRQNFSVTQTLSSADQSPLSLPPSSAPHGLQALADSRLRTGGPPTLGSLGPTAGPTWPYPPPPHPTVFTQGAPGFPEGLGPNGHQPGAMQPSGGTSIMENWENWRQFQQAAYANNLDPHMLAFYHNTGCPMDLSNAPRRKNATRETTSMLKAWLNEHRKNPYPTKGEKIMLAIITKMTLTQVSTWFANARRRLKKENKMTWSPRNRSEEERQNETGGLSTGGQRCSDDEDDDNSINVDNDDDDDLGDLDDFDVMTDDDNDARFSSVKEKIVQSLTLDVGETTDPGNQHVTDKLSATLATTSSSAVSSENPLSQPKKPKIWSLVDTAAKEDPLPKNPQYPPTVAVSSLAPLNYLGVPGQGMNPSCPPGLPLASLLPSNGAPMFSTASKFFPSMLIPPQHQQVPTSHLPLHMNPATSAAAAAYLQNPFLYAGFNLHPFSTFPGRNPIPDVRDSLKMFPEHATFYGMDPLKSVSLSPNEYSVSSSPPKS